MTYLLIVFEKVVIYCGKENSGGGRRGVFFLLMIAQVTLVLSFKSP